jgi:glucuronoarabinoxylan endo-1,4-beta-xylanase
MFVSTVFSYGQNLATNPGFETGDTSGWFAFGAPTISAQSTQVHSGTFAALVQNRTATYNGIAQTLTSVLQPNQTYNISAWVRIGSGAAQTMQLTLKKTDAGGDQYAAVASGSVSSTAWTQLSGQYTLTVSGTLTGLTFYAEMPSSATNDFYIDDVSIITNVVSSPGTNGTTTVNWTDVRQHIDGFGASSAWRSTWSTANADTYFSTNTGLGLSLLRTRIAPGGTTIENTIMQYARDRGARVWSAPWSPDTPFKSNTNVNGGSFVGTPANYQAYASQLAGYVVNMQNQYGVNLYALSVQNEPDANVTTYESCNWTSQQIHDFVPYLYNALNASNVGSTKIVMPESQNWTDPQGLASLSMNDASVAPMVGIMADHNYVGDNNGGDQSTPAAIQGYGKAVWETEVSTFNAFDGSIANGMYWAKRIHGFMTVAQANAWHFWWLSGANNEGLADSSDVLAKRGYVLGQYSRFVRPDYYRIGTITNSGTALVSAFKDPITLKLAIVAINAASTVVTQAFNINNVSNVTLLTPWITSSTLSIAAQSAISVTNNSFTYQLPAMSVVTFAGQASNSPPAIAAVSNRTIADGAILQVTNIATDPDVPLQSLSYQLVQGPVNASINSSNGVLTWRPDVAQAGSTNVFKVSAKDNGSPNLSSTNNFTVVVASVNPPTVSFASGGTGQINLTITGSTGPDYIVQTSTNLIDWQPLLTTNPPALPFTVTIPSGPEPQRFYRIRLGP